MFKQILEGTTVEPTNATMIARTMIQGIILRKCLIQLERKSKHCNEIAALKAEKSSNATPKNLIGFPSHGRDATIKEQAQNTRRKQ